MASLGTEIVEGPGISWLRLNDMLSRFNESFRDLKSVDAGIKLVNDNTRTLDRSIKEATDDICRSVVDASVRTEQVLLEAVQKLSEINEEAPERIASCINDAELARKEQQKRNNQLYLKSLDFFRKGKFSLKKKDFLQALGYLNISRDAASNISSSQPILRNGLSLQFNIRFLRAFCLDRLREHLESFQIYLNLYSDASGEDINYHQLFVQNFLVKEIVICSKSIWLSWGEDKRRQLLNPDSLTIVCDPYSDFLQQLPVEWKTLWVLNSCDSNFSHLRGAFSKIEASYNERAQSIGQLVYEGCDYKDRSGYTRKEKMDMIERLPKRLQNIMYSPDTGAFAIGLGHRYQVDERLISRILGYLILGILSTDLMRVAEEVNKMVTPDSKKAIAIARELVDYKVKCQTGNF